MAEQSQPNYQLKFEYFDTGFCRIVFSLTGSKTGKKFYYCFQDEGHGVVTYNSCTDDHEPICEVSLKPEAIIAIEAPIPSSSAENQLWNSVLMFIDNHHQLQLA